MLYSKDDTIDTRYRVLGVCSDTGGMGTLLFVVPLDPNAETNIVLKYCKATEGDALVRFKREVRLLASFKGNSKVAQVLDENVDHDPPYFVMRFYPDGDLSPLAGKITGDYEKQEQPVHLKALDSIGRGGGI